MSGVNKFILSGLSVLLVLGGGCSMGFVPTGLTPAKAYGEYWTKPGMTTESWRQDWVACGGMKDGGYASDAPSGSTSITLRTAETKKRNELSLCMQAKGYTYHYTGP